MTTNEATSAINVGRRHQQRVNKPLAIQDYKKYMGGVDWMGQVSFYPTARKGCRGIVFTHSVPMGGRAAEKVCPGCISETVRCRKLILGRDIGSDV